jgi:hypothetical protein
MGEVHLGPRLREFAARRSRTPEARNDPRLFPIVAVRFPDLGSVSFPGPGPGA